MTALWATVAASPSGILVPPAYEPPQDVAVAPRSGDASGGGTVAGALAGGGTVAGAGPLAGGGPFAGEDPPAGAARSRGDPLAVERRPDRGVAGGGPVAASRPPVTPP